MALLPCPEIADNGVELPAATPVVAVAVEEEDDDECTAEAGVEDVAALAPPTMLRAAIIVARSTGATCPGPLDAGVVELAFDPPTIAVKSN